MIRNYLRQNLHIEDYAKFVEAWEIHRCADGAENVYDLWDYIDFYHFATMYGENVALNAQKGNRFWFGGMNFTAPLVFPQTIGNCIEFVDKSIDKKYIIERPDIYEKWVDTKKLLNNNFYLVGNTENREHPLEYNVVLQWFSVVFYKCFENNTDCFKEDISEDNVMDIAANLAYEFHSIHQCTAWETTFIDYVYHFIINELEIKSSLLSDYVVNYDKLIDYFKQRGGYWDTLMLELMRENQNK